MSSRFSNWSQLQMATAWDEDRKFGRGRHFHFRKKIKAGFQTRAGTNREHGSARLSLSVSCALHDSSGLSDQDVTSCGLCFSFFFSLVTPEAIRDACSSGRFQWPGGGARDRPLQIGACCVVHIVEILERRGRF